jgi:hypothetical protein
MSTDMIIIMVGTASPALLIRLLPSAHYLASNAALTTPYRVHGRTLVGPAYLIFGTVSCLLTEDGLAAPPNKSRRANSPKAPSSQVSLTMMMLRRSKVSVTLVAHGYMHRGVLSNLKHTTTVGPEQRK